MLFLKMKYKAMDDKRKELYYDLGYQEDCVYEFQVVIQPPKALGVHVLEDVLDTFGSVGYVICLYSSCQQTPLCFASLEQLLGDWEVSGTSERYKVVENHKV